ncbi:MAG: hypothetical protein Q8K63_09160 [Acidimicrobiales bacterium]|nr:hypothetical protein [Acidimicrobiales bacterium]
MAFAELVGVGEVAEILGVSRQRVHQLKAAHADFPEPLGRLRAGYIWRKQDIVRWAKQTGRA